MYVYIDVLNYGTVRHTFHGCSVRVDNIKSSLCPTNAHTTYSKVVELLKTFKSTIIAPTCFGLHKPSSGSSQCVFCHSYNIDFSVCNVVNEVFGAVAAHFVPSRCVCILCTVHSAQCTIYVG